MCVIFYYSVFYEYVNTTGNVRGKKPSLSGAANPFGMNKNIYMMQTSCLDADYSQKYCLIMLIQIFYLFTFSNVKTDKNGQLITNFLKIAR